MPSAEFTDDYSSSNYSIQTILAVDADSNFRPGSDIVDNRVLPSNFNFENNQRLKNCHML